MFGTLCRSVAGLDPRAHRLFATTGLAEIVFPRRWMRGSSPRMTTHRVSACGKRAGGPCCLRDVGSLEPSGPAFRRGRSARRHRRDLGGGMHVAVPALGEGRGNVELVEHTRDDVVDDVVDGLRMVVE